MHQGTLRDQPAALPDVAVLYRVLTGADGLAQPQAAAVIGEAQRRVGVRGADRGQLPAVAPAHGRPVVPYGRVPDRVVDFSARCSLVEAAAAECQPHVIAVTLPH